MFNRLKHVDKTPIVCMTNDESYYNLDPSRLKSYNI